MKSLSQRTAVAGNLVGQHWLQRRIEGSDDF